MGRAILPGFPGLAAGDPARLVRLRRAAQGQRPGRDVFGDRRAGAHVRAVPDLDRSHELRVAADEGPLPDLRAVFLLAVVVARDDARTDVRFRSDVGVAQVREM